MTKKSVLVKKMNLIVRAHTDKTLKARAKIILVMLAKYSNNDTNMCWPSQQTLSDDSGLSVRSIGYAIKELVNSGYIMVTNRGKMNLSSVYELIYPEDEKGSCNKLSEPHAIPGIPSRNNQSNRLQANVETFRTDMRTNSINRTHLKELDSKELDKNLEIDLDEVKLLQPSTLDRYSKISDVEFLSFRQEMLERLQFEIQYALLIGKQVENREGWRKLRSRIKHILDVT
jgi:hypothetical protein